MELTWLGRYRNIVLALVHHSNCVSRRLGVPIDRGMGISLTSQEFQLLEAVIENEDKILNLSDYFSITGITRSSLTLASKKLLAYELIEKFKLAGNNKNVILRPTEKGKELYINSCNRTGRKAFKVFFEKLDFLTDEQLEKVADAIMSLDEEIDDDAKVVLIKQ